MVGKSKREVLIEQVEAEALRIRGAPALSDEPAGKVAAAAATAALADAEPAPERIYTWHESISGWAAARAGYARQEAARVAAWKKAMEPPPPAQGPPAPMPRNYDGNVHGTWFGEPKVLPPNPRWLKGPDDELAPPPPPPSPPTPSTPAYNYDTETSWRSHVLPDGNIIPYPHGSGRRWWGPV
jgi:hypothetical protein